MIDSNGYAVVDVETTGLFPGGSDRIIEIAVIRLDAHGKFLSEYSTLVNPLRDIGATHIHGITSSDVLNAPTFNEIIGDVINHMNGAALVAHNVSFDRRFLRSEFERLNYGIPDIPCFCTMQLSKYADQGIPSRRLDVLCDYFGIDPGDAHTAYSDAKATVQLFELCVNQMGGWNRIRPKHHCIKPMCTECEAWPEIEPSGISYNRFEANQDSRKQPSYIRKLVGKLPAGPDDDPVVNEYLFLLDRVLEDRIVDEHEYSQMLLLANELGMTRDQAIAAHDKYMHQLILVALEDGVITEAEENDLSVVRKLLGISKKHYNLLMKNAIEQYEAGLQVNCTHEPYPSLVGKSVCFTGSFNSCIDGEMVTRTMAKQMAIDAGMDVQKGVTKKLDILVVADPNSMSIKAQKARDYGIRIIAEPVFWRMIGICVD